jgi:hypothetical protein
LFELDIPSISAMVAAAGVLVGVALTVLQLRAFVKDRHIDLAFRMNPWMNISGSELTEAIAKVWSLEYKDYDDFVERYGFPVPSERPEQKALHMIMNYFEGIGLLLKRNLMDVDFAWDLFGSSYFVAWEKVKPLVEGLRKQYDTPDAWSYFEYLYNEMKKREQKLQQSKA